MTSRALIAVLTVGAFAACGDDTPSNTTDGGDSTTADGSTGSEPTTDDPTSSDPTTGADTDSGPTASTGEGSSGVEGTSTGTDPDTADGSSSSDADDSSSSGGGDDDSSSTGSESSSSTGAQSVAFCGDGTLDAGEECDDGDGNEDTAACTATCTLNVCGDGFLHAPVETCDDGNADDLDACHNDCSPHEAIELALGSDFTCARFDSGRLKCWGHGASGRLGYGNLESIGDDETPAASGFVALGQDAYVEQVVAGAAHTCVALADGSARCWGAAGAGQLGYGNMIPIGDNEPVTSVEPIPFGEGILALGTGSGAFHGCAALQSGDVKCWGQAASYKLGVVGQGTNLGDNESLGTTPTTDVGDTITDVVAGQSHTCARTSLGNVRCWGTNSSAALGYGTPNDVGDDETPAAAGDVPLSDFVIDIASGWQHNCAVLESGDVQCWGRANDGRLGYGSLAYVGYANTPASVGSVSLDGSAREVAAGLAHSCALLEDDSVQCWGSGAFGQLGYGNVESIGDDELPSTAGTIPLPRGVRHVAAGGNHTCVITDLGTIQCWGQGANGRLGYGNTANLGDDEPLEALPEVEVF